MVILADRAGAFKLRDRSTPRYIQMFYNRLFINMSHMMDYPKRVWLNTPEDVQFALSGKVFPAITAAPETSFPVRMINFLRQVVNTLKAEKHLTSLKLLTIGFSIDVDQSMHDLYLSLEHSRIALGTGFGYHLGTSAQSGTLYSAFMRIMTGGKRLPTAEDHHIATIMLLDIPDIESADAVKSLEKFASLIRKDFRFAEKFVTSSPEEALQMLRDNCPPEVRLQFRQFIERHGHRCVRESELREKTWEENPLRLVHILQIRVKTGEIDHKKQDFGLEVEAALSNFPLVKRSVLKLLIPAARKAVARREISKGLSIKMVSIVRKGYQVLANKMVDAGLLDDPDQIFFLTHEEIGSFLSDKNPGWKSKANKRRSMLPELDKLVFDEVSFGIPEPLEQTEAIVVSEGQLKGIPVSRGLVEGPARIINTLEEAEQLREGEIMVASFTDIGWTPYFSIIAGLVTEIGSPLSHGAVVAREFGIPAVVGAKGARGFLKNGDWVRLNGDKGIVEKL
jgi:pyruvate,water dikinase